MPSHKTVGAKIKSLRIQKELRQHELASFLSVTSSTISNWENDRRTPSLDELIRIANFFQVSLNAFAISDQFELDIEHRTKDYSNQISQNIKVSRFTIQISRLQYALVYVLVLIVFFSYFFQGVLKYFLFFFGSLSIVSIAINLIVSFAQTRKTHTINIPKDYSVYYQHEEETERIRKKHSLLKLIVVISFIAVIGFTIMLSTWAFGQQVLWIGALIASFSFLLLVFEFCRLQHIFSSRFFVKYIDYNEGQHFRLSPALVMTPIFETFILILFSVFIIFDLAIMRRTQFAIFAMMNISLNIGLSFFICYRYFDMMSALNLYAKDAHGVKHKLM